MITDNTQELDELLDRLMQYSYNYGSGSIPTSENPPLIIARQTKRALLDWHNKQVLEIIGEDEQANLREISRDVDMDSALALREYRLARNDLRAEQRSKLKESK